MKLAVYVPYSMCNAYVEVSQKPNTEGFKIEIQKYAIGKLFCVLSTIFWTYQYHEHKSMSDATDITDMALH